MKKTIIILMIIVAMMIVSTAGVVAVKEWKNAKDEAEIKKVVLAVARLKDPKSVQFEELVVANHNSLEDGKPGITWCGKINAKNSYGAYTGFKKFAVRIEGGESRVIVEDDDDPEKLYLIGIKCQ